MSNAFKYAATIVLLIYGGFEIISNGISLKDNQNYFVEVYTGDGERKTVILPDSSTVVLNANSYCRYSTKTNTPQREIALKGEGFFNVRPNKKRPFIVHTSQVKTTVLGTSFNVNSSQSSAVISVATGRVKVESLQHDFTPVELIKNEQINYNATTRIAQLAQVDAIYISDWSRGILHFQNTPFIKVIEDLEHWYGVSIHLRSTDFNNRTITGKYEGKSISFVLDDLSFMLDLKYEIKESMILISK